MPGEASSRGKRPVVGSVLVTGFPRPSGEAVAALAGTDVSALSDAVGRMYTMNGTIRSLYEHAVPVIGVASTVKCPPGDNLAVFKALTLVEPGDVLVIDGQGFSEWCLGGFQILQYARAARGLAGLLVNGAYRDVREAQEVAFPLYATAFAPHSGPNVGGGEINVPVCCGGVIVHPGDVVSASGEGIVVVPQAWIPEVLGHLGGPGGDWRSGGGKAPEAGTVIEQLVTELSAEFDRGLRKSGPE